MSQHNQFSPKKSLGQNFLINPGVIERIISACHLKPDDIVLEVGPGQGALTHHLCGNTKKVIAIEKDGHLATQLQTDLNGENTDIIHDDILAYSFGSLPDKIKGVGNLPYNIATPIIEKVILNRKKFSAFYMTVQLEYGQRLVAKENSKKYGSLSCFVQFYADAKILFKINKSSFRPIPKVQSCFIQLNFPDTPKYSALDERRLFAMIRACFGQRRKTIVNSLSTIMHKETAEKLLHSLAINPKLRAENISVEKYVQLSNLAVNEEKSGRKIFI